MSVERTVWQSHKIPLLEDELLEDNEELEDEEKAVIEGDDIEELSFVDDRRDRDWLTFWLLDFLKGTMSWYPIFNSLQWWFHRQIKFLDTSLTISPESWIATSCHGILGQISRSTLAAKGSSPNKGAVLNIGL